jgi:hypothetical protein
MTDAEAREYGIAALEALATELEGAIVHSRELDAHEYIDRMRTAASRLDDERGEEDVALRLVVLEEAVVELGQRIDFVTGRLIGGPPAAGPVLLDGQELDRDERRTLILENIQRRRRDEDSQPFRQSQSNSPGIAGFRQSFD